MEIQDVSFWANQPEYEAWEAACLICDIEPAASKVLGASASKARKIHGRISMEIPPCHDTSTTKPVSNWVTGTTRMQPVSGRKFYSKEGIKAWCEANNFRPKFLFLDDPENKPLSTKRKNTYLMVIAGLLRECKINPDQSGVSEAIEAILDKQGVSVTAKTIKSILGEIPDALANRTK